jgi:dihydroorotase
MGGALEMRAGEPVAIVLRGASVLDPVAGIEGVHDVVIRDGAIAELAAPGAAEIAGAETVEAEGMHAFPAFFDPHVHLRTPGHEHKEDIETGTRAAAAGGFCGILAMANTEPPVSIPADVTALRERAATDASVGVGFLATVTAGMRGEELTEMVALREAGAVGFSDDGLPITNAGILRRALQYQRLCGGTIALHEEDPALSGDGVMHEGPVSAALGLAGIPSVSEATMIARGEGGSTSSTSPRPSRWRRCARPRPPASRSAARPARTTSASPTRRCAASTRCASR